MVLCLITGNLFHSISLFSDSINLSTISDTFTLHPSFISTHLNPRFSTPWMELGKEESHSEGEGSNIPSFPFPCSFPYPVPNTAEKQQMEGINHLQFIVLLFLTLLLMRLLLPLDILPRHQSIPYWKSQPRAQILSGLSSLR